MPLILGKSGVNKELKEIYLGNLGINKKEKELYLGKSGVNKQIYTSTLFELANVPIGTTYVFPIPIIPNSIEFTVYITRKSLPRTLSASFNLYTSATLENRIRFSSFRDFMDVEEEGSDDSSMILDLNSSYVQHAMLGDGAYKGTVKIIIGNSSISIYGKGVLKNTYTFAQLGITGKPIIHGYYAFNNNTTVQTVDITNLIIK